MNAGFCIAIGEKNAAVLSFEGLDWMEGGNGEV